jgi:hypothetical protein
MAEACPMRYAQVQQQQQVGNGMVMGGGMMYGGANGYPPQPMPLQQPHMSGGGGQIVGYTATGQPVFASPPPQGGGSFVYAGAGAGAQPIPAGGVGVGGGVGMNGKSVGVAPLGGVYSPPQQEVLFRGPSYRHVSPAQGGPTTVYLQPAGSSTLATASPQAGMPANANGQQQQQPSDSGDGCCLFVCLAGVCAGLYACLKCS